MGYGAGQRDRDNRRRASATIRKVRTVGVPYGARPPGCGSRPGPLPHHGGASRGN
ncbi:MAG: hypothetical protein MZV64_09205 [Ignavibacteriales bacterium]|nr:hypothetical protein [Ignavibacteriales bacterium]